ncbi:transposase family protein [Roseimaritima ulvae]|uniref:transposase family protein n=1 Tax=Roseimaritima ulvae TaxID=980254 RepID=UPI00138FE4C8
MWKKLLLAFERCLTVVDGARVQWCDAHRTHSKLLQFVAALISDAAVAVGTEGFGKARENWLEEFVTLPRGMNSCGTIGRILSLLRSAQFNLHQWAGTVGSEGNIVPTTLSSFPSAVGPRGGATHAQGIRIHRALLPRG